MKKTWKRAMALLLALVCTIGVVGCGQNQETSEEEPVIVKVGVVGEFNAQWEVINELLADDGIQVELVKYTDYAVPNRALHDGEIDMNAFQHKAFLANDIAEKGYEIEALGETVVVALAMYNNKDKISSVEDIKDGDVIGIPSDATNGGRALKLLEAAGILKCDPEKGYMPTKLDVVEYYVDVELMEADSASLNSLLPDCAAVIINGGNAFTAGLSDEDAIFVEDINPETNPGIDPFINILAVRSADKDSEVLKKVVDAYRSKEVLDKVKVDYKGAFRCTWEAELE